MYDSLTVRELAVLQDVLFRATEEAYWVVNANDGDSAWHDRYHPLHRELASLFLQAGEELLMRLDQPDELVKTPAPPVFRYRGVPRRRVA